MEIMAIKYRGTKKEGEVPDRVRLTADAITIHGVSHVHKSTQFTLIK